MIRLISTFLCLLMLTACGSKEQFTVGGELEGLGDQTVTMTYYADGGIKQESRAAQQGRFVLRGVSATPTLCILEVATFGQIAAVVASNGDKLRLTGDITDPLRINVEGNGVSEKISQWTAANADIIRGGDAARINRSLALFVADNRKSLASTALMVTRFQAPGYEQLADSLLQTISPDARPTAVIHNFRALLSTQLSRQAADDVKIMLLRERSDTIVRLTPHAQTLTLIAFRNPGSPQDTVARLLRESADGYPPRRLQVFEISTAADSALWKQSTERDSATWHQTWAPGSVAMPEVRRLNVPRIPFFIVADSLGAQVYRGSSTRAVRDLLTRRLGAPGKH